MFGMLPGARRSQPLGGIYVRWGTSGKEIVYVIRAGKEKEIGIQRSPSRVASTVT